MRARVVVDATLRASLARLAGARFTPYPPGLQQFRRVVVGGEGCKADGVAVRAIPLRTPLGGKSPTQYGSDDWSLKKNALMSQRYDSVLEYALTLPMRNASFAEAANVEQLARDLTFHPDQFDESEVLFQVPPDPVVAAKRATGDWPGADRADLDWFRPRRLPGIYVLGGCADVPRAAAEELLRPLEFLALGERIGAAAAAEAKALKGTRRIYVAGDRSGSPIPGDTKEFLNGLRSTQPAAETIAVRMHALPVLAEYDVRGVGDYILTPLDTVNQRTFPDTIGMSDGGHLDTHGYTVHPYYTVNGWEGGITYTPYRCLLPQGLDGMLVVGIGVSAHRDAQPSIRMEPCMQNLGYAARVCAAQAIARNVTVRDIDIRAVQRHLVDVACLTRDVLEHVDSFPFPYQALRRAAEVLADRDYSGLNVLMTNPDSTASLMRKLHAAPGTSAEGKLRYAHVLALLGDRTGVPTLVAKVEEYDVWDNERIGMKWHPSNTWLDSYIIALGYARDRRGTAPIVAKLGQLGSGAAGSRFSHYRSTALALEMIGDSPAAPSLAEVLKRSKPTDATVLTLGKDLARKRTKAGQTQLILARALYRLGDCEGLGETVLTTYARDLRGVYARHAHAVLGER